MKLPIRQVDAFTEGPFGGNPAAVCPLEAWIPDALMQAIALENNLSETAFLVPRDATRAEWDLRWFTPATEVELCGHATLASGFVVLNELAPDLSLVRFHTQSGPLSVERTGPDPSDELAMELPSRPPQPSTIDPAYAAALGAQPSEGLAGIYTLCIFEREAQVRALVPDMRALNQAEPNAVICSAPADDPSVHFVSRLFAPAKGIDEDPVTGSAHATLTPYWSARLGTKELIARQISARGGALRCVDQGERVRLFGRVAPYLSGTIEVPATL